MVEQVFAGLELVMLEDRRGAAEPGCTDYLLVYDAPPPCMQLSCSCEIKNVATRLHTPHDLRTFEVGCRRPSTTAASTAPSPSAWAAACRAR